MWALILEFSLNPLFIGMSLKLLHLKLKAEVDEEMSRENSCVIINDYNALLSLGVGLVDCIDSLP